MPIYEYRCDKCDKSRELVASIVQKYEVTCDNCNVPMWRVWHPTPAIFKGEGWAGKKFAKDCGINIHSLEVRLNRAKKREQRDGNQGTESGTSSGEPDS